MIERKHSRKNFPHEWKRKDEREARLFCTSMLHLNFFSYINIYEIQVLQMQQSQWSHSMHSFYLGTSRSGDDLESGSYIQTPRTPRPRELRRQNSQTTTPHFLPKNPKLLGVLQKAVAKESKTLPRLSRGWFVGCYVDFLDFTSAVKCISFNDQ